MRLLFRFALLMALFAVGGVAVIKFLYDVSWDDAVEIADQFIVDLLV